VGGRGDVAAGFAAARSRAGTGAGDRSAGAVRGDLLVRCPDAGVRGAAGHRDIGGRGGGLALAARRRRVEAALIALLLRTAHLIYVWSRNHIPAKSFGSIEQPFAAFARSHVPASLRGTSCTRMSSVSSPPPSPTLRKSSARTKCIISVLMPADEGPE